MPPPLSPIRFIVPGIAGTPTGGNIYNARVLEHWPESEPAAKPETVTWPVDTPPRDPVDEVPPEAVVIVDSLCLKHVEAIQALRARRPDARIILLAHYLACVDPRESDSTTASAERELLPLLDGAITPSQFVRQALLREGIPASSVTVAPPGLDERFRQSARGRNFSESASGTSSASHLLTVANVLPGKGLDVLLPALEELQDLTWTWRLIGGTELDPSYGEAFRQQLQQSPICDRMTWTGTAPATEMPAAYEQADLFVLPTHFETCSMATREAMARGCAIVASRVGGLPENFGEHEAGGLVPPNDADALAGTLRLLLTDSSRRASLARAALAQSQSFPSWDTTAVRCARAIRRLRPPSASRAGRGSREDLDAGRTP